jgi:hypothetical protein
MRIAIAALLLVTACADDAPFRPEVCDIEDPVQREFSCQQSCCPTSESPTCAEEMCPGASLADCMADCITCTIGDRWCPED